MRWIQRRADTAFRMNFPVAQQDLHQGQKKLKKKKEKRGAEEMNEKTAWFWLPRMINRFSLVVQQALARHGFGVQSSGTAAGLWKLIESGKGDVLITDVALPDGDALDLLPRIQECRPDLPVIVMSARSTLLTAVKAQQIGVFEYLPKPFELRSLIEVTQRAVATLIPIPSAIKRLTTSKRVGR